MVTYLQGNGTPGPSPSPTAEEIDASLLGKRAKKEELKKPQAPVAPLPPKEETRVMAAEQTTSRPAYRTRTVRAETKTDEENA